MAVGRWERLAPLTGLVGVVIILLAFVVLGGSTPSTSDPASKFVSFYHAHRHRQSSAAYVLAIGATFLLFFGGSLRGFLAPTRRLATIAFGGFVVTVGGFYAGATVHLALADSGKYAFSEPATVHALGILDSDFYLPFALGLGAAVLASGFSLLHTRALPMWFAIVSIVIGVACFTPAGFFGFAGCGLWVIVVSVWLTVRQPTMVALPA